MNENLKGKLPMEYTIAETDSTKCSLMGLHRQIFDAKRKALKRYSNCFPSLAQENHLL